MKLAVKLDAKDWAAICLAFYQLAENHRDPKQAANLAVLARKLISAHDRAKETSRQAMAPYRAERKRKAQAPK